jgi:hypothetical protein
MKLLFYLLSILYFTQLIKMQASSSSSSSDNLLVYIARLDEKYSEKDIINIIHYSNIGRVEYADITAVRDNSPAAGPEPEIKFYSAFVMISRWNLDAREDFNKFGQLKVWVDSKRVSYLMLRPSPEGSAIPRSKVNTHQLAHYTAELYKRMDAADKKIESEATMSEDNNIRLTYCTKDLYNKMHAAEMKIDEQSRIIDDQNERMSHMLEMMEKLLVSNEELSNKLASTQMTLSCMDAFMAARFSTADNV